MARDTKLMREIGGIVLNQVRHALATRGSLATRAPADLAGGEQEPPVVAQLMIEIRSDGSRTIARGALNDLRNGESAQLHAQGRSPSELMLSLASSLLALPGGLFEAVRKVPKQPEKEEALASDAPLPPRPRERD